MENTVSPQPPTRVQAGLPGLADLVSGAWSLDALLLPWVNRRFLAPPGAR